MNILKTKLLSDLVKIILILSVIISISIYVDFHEKIVYFTQKYEAWELDEILFIGTFFTLACFLWYSRRRSKELEKSEKLIKVNEARYRSLVESTDDSIYLIDRNYRYLFMNKKHLSRMKLSDDQYMGKSYSHYHSPEESKLFKEKADNIFTTGISAQYEYKSLRDGRYFLQTYSPVKDQGDRINAVTVVSKDISERKQMEEDLHSLSLRDELTGLYNRRGFITLSAQYLKIVDRQKQGIFMLYADLDNLKWINDNLGHNEGDKAIIKTAKILKKNYRKSDIIARMGGDEFVVLPVGVTGDSVDIISSRLQKALDDLNSKSKIGYKLSLSIGIAYYNPEHPCSIEDLIAQGDELMYEQKKLRKKIS
jgi:diguanylate cyclase (GGDEF)-like protein/PAS domain S-box-containing protein